MSAIAFQAWLHSEQDFTQGVQLYAQHPAARPALVALLHRAGAGPFTTGQLVQEMERLVAEQLPAAEEPTPSTDGVEQPVAVASLIAERVQLFKEASNLHGTLRHLATDAERYEAARGIKAHFRRIDEIWDALRYHEQHGALPPIVDSVIADNDPAAWTKRRNTLRTYLSSQRGTREKRAAWQAELAELERKLHQ